MTTETSKMTEADTKALVRQQQEDTMVDSLTKLLPQHIDPKRFIALALAVYRDPNLRECTNQSKMLALADCAKLGLIPDRNLGHVWLVPFNNRFQDHDDGGKWKSRKEVTLIPGYQGYIELARRSGLITTVHTQLVREGDDFRSWIDEAGPHLRFERQSGDDAKITHVFCIAKLRNGESQIEVLTMAQVNKIRDVSKATKSGPWFDWEEEMIRKSAVRRARKYWPQSADLAQLGSLDDFADGIVSRDQVDNMSTSAGLAAAPVGRLKLSGSPDPEPEPLEDPPPVEEDPQPGNSGAKGNAKTKEKPKAKQPGKTKTQPDPVSEPRENTKSKVDEGVPVSSKKRHEWLAHRAMVSCGEGDTAIAMRVTQRWMMINQIAPSCLTQEAVFESTQAMMDDIDWKPLFLEYIEVEIEKAKAKAGS